METPPVPESEPRRSRDDGFFGWFGALFSSDTDPAKPGSGDGAPPEAPEAGADAGGDSGGGDGGGGGGGD